VKARAATTFIFTVFACLTSLYAKAQPSTQTPNFEVASVKRNNSADLRGFSWQFRRDGFTAHNLPLYIIVATAYGIPMYSNRLSKGPNWIYSEKYDIEAKAETPTSRNQTRSMLQALLTDRFKLVVRREKKEMPVYAAVAAKNGLKLTRSTMDEKDCPEGAPNYGGACHSVVGGIGRGIHGEAASISDILALVENWSDRPLVDKTGINGLFEVQTDGWAPLIPRPLLPGVERTAEDIAMADPSRPTLFAIFERMGIKLEAQGAAIETIFIEQIERPTEN